MNRDGEAMGDSLRQLNLSDNRNMEQLTALLSGEGLTRDANLDYCCGIFDEDERLIATGSCAGCTLRCLAVAAGHRGEGLLNRIVSHLNEVQLARGNSHLFVYTKTSSARFIASLGFYEITRVDGLVYDLGETIQLEKNKKHKRARKAMVDKDQMSLFDFVA